MTNPKQRAMYNKNKDRKNRKVKKEKYHSKNL